MNITLAEGVPDSEVSRVFLQGMVDRMAMSYYKYGKISEAYPHRVNAVAELQRRLEKYKRDGNTEWLMDVANFAMIEFVHPAHPEAHFRATDSRESGGRVWHGETNPCEQTNRLERVHD